MHGNSGKNVAKFYIKCILYENDITAKFQVWLSELWLGYSYGLYLEPNKGFIDVPYFLNMRQLSKLKAFFVSKIYAHTTCASIGRTVYMLPINRESVGVPYTVRSFIIYDNDVTLTLT